MCQAAATKKKTVAANVAMTVAAAVSVAVAANVAAAVAIAVAVVVTVAMAVAEKTVVMPKTKSDITINQAMKKKVIKCQDFKIGVEKTVAVKKKPSRNKTRRERIKMGAIREK